MPSRTAVDLVLFRMAGRDTTGSDQPLMLPQWHAIEVPNGRYKVKATSESSPCPDGGGEYCQSGQSQACVNQVRVVRALGNNGFKDIIGYRASNSPNPAAPLIFTDYHNNVMGNGKYYISVEDGYALDDLPEAAAAGFSCPFKVTLTKVG